MSEPTTTPPPTTPVTPVPSRARHSNPAGSCPFCLGLILKHWCEECNTVHANGHSSRCPLAVACLGLDPDLTGWIGMRDEQGLKG
jgi:hypothetical protein